MATLTPEAQEGLGLAVRELRLAKGMTQEQLGEEAEYRSGAGVSISRLESGLLKPDEKRLEKIAKALGLSLITLAEVAADLAKNPSPDSSLATKQRLERVQHELEERAVRVADLGAPFNEAHERARDAFLLPLIQIAARVTDTAPPAAVGRDIVRDEDVATEAAYGIDFTRFGVAQALASTADAPADAPPGAVEYSAFTAAVAGAAASAAIASSQSTKPVGRGLVRALGVRSSPTLRKATAASAALALGGAVAAGVAAALYAQQRHRKQVQDEVTTRLSQAEGELKGSQPNVDALCELMPDATHFFDYVAVHASHALRRWEAQVAPKERLTYEDRARWEEFVDIAAAQLAVASLDFEELMLLRGEEFEQANAVAHEILGQANTIVTSRV